MTAKMKNQPLDYQSTDYIPSIASSTPTQWYYGRSTNPPTDRTPPLSRKTHRNPPPTSKLYQPRIGHLPHSQLLQGQMVTRTIALNDQNLYGLQSNLRELFGGNFGQQGRTMSNHAIRPPLMPPPPPWPPPPMPWPPWPALQVSRPLIIPPVSPNVDPRRPLLQPLGLSKAITDGFPLNPPTVISVVATAINSAGKLSPIMTGPVRQMEIFYNILHTHHPLQQLPPPHIPPWPPPPGNDWDHVKAASVTVCTPMVTTSFGYVEAMLLIRAFRNWTGNIVGSTRHILHRMWYQMGAGNNTANTTSASKTPSKTRISMKPTKRLVNTSPLTRSNFAKSLWRAGDISKPDYTTYCNNLHTLHQECLQGKIGPVKLQEGKQELLEAINKKRFSTSYSHNKKSINSFHPAVHPTFILELSKHSEHHRHGSARKMKISHEAPNSRQHRRQKREHRVVLGGSKVQAHGTAWCSRAHERVRQLLDRKRPAVSVVAGAAQKMPTTQRQLPARRRKEQRWLSV